MTLAAGRFIAIVILFATVFLPLTAFADPVGEDGLDAELLDSAIAEQGLLFPANGGKALGSVLMDTSHSPYGQPLNTSYSSFITMCQNLGFTVFVGNDFANLQNYDVVVEKMPQTAFSAADVIAIASYLDGGGIFLLFGEYNSGGWSNAPVANLLEDLSTGIHFHNNTVYDPLSNYSSTIWPVVVNYSNHCLNNGVTQMIHPATGFFTVDNPVSALYFSTSLAWLGTYEAVSPPYILAAIPDPTVHPTWRLLVTGDSNHFSTYATDYFSLLDNAVLAENEVLWCENCAEHVDCDDGVFCNGAEQCNQVSFMCEPGTLPCADDGMWCSGAESCDEDADQCVSEYDAANPRCPDDGAFCNGIEACDEDADECFSPGDPCADDGQWCTGQESCDEDADQCVSTGDPCIDDGEFCNGTESCEEATDTCASSGDPCEDSQTCDESADECISDTDDDDEAPDLRDDDDDDTDQGGEKDLWPDGKVSGGNSNCCG